MGPTARLSASVNPPLPVPASMTLLPGITFSFMSA